MVLDETGHTTPTIRDRSALWAGLGATPARCLRAFGMRRSGNHAIADWILRNSAGTGSVFLNNCVPGQSPLASFRTIAVNGTRKPMKRARADLARTCAPAGTSATVLATYEDVIPGLRRKRPISGALDDAFDIDLIFYRSFLNWCASLLKKLHYNQDYSHSARAAVVLKSIDLYTHMLSLVADADGLGLIPVCFDDWHASQAYRTGRLAALGLEPVDNGIGAVQSYGGGSSFQKQTDTPEDLTTDRRFDQMADDPGFRNILTIAARDQALLHRLDAIFPADAERLCPFANGRL